MATVISEVNDLNSINWVQGLSDPGEMIRCGYLPEIRRMDGEQDEEYAERIRPIVMALPKEQRDQIMGSAIKRANLDASTGKVAVFVAGQAAWHRVGKQIDQAATSEEAIKLAVLDWTVIKKQLFLDDNSQVPGAFATVRTDTNKPLGVVGSKYVPFQNVEAFKFLDALVGEGLARYESAGALDGGKRVWMLLRLPQEIVVGENDKVHTYVLLTNSHDGSGAIRVIPTSVRVVCQNTLNMSLKQGDREKCLYIRHTKNVQAAVEEAREKFGIVLKRVESFHQEIDALAKVTLTETQVTEYLEQLYPTKSLKAAPAAPVAVNGASILDQMLAAADEGREVVADLLAGDAEEQTQTQKRNAKIVEQILANYHNDKNNLPGIEGTAWSLLNATTEFLDHQSTVRGQDDAAKANNRLNSIWFGAAAEKKEEAFELALQVAGGSSKQAV